MKKFFVLWIVSLTVAFVSCKDDKTETPAQWFEQPEVTAVSATTAEVVCRTEFAEGALNSSKAGFSCTLLTENGTPGTAVDFTDCTVDGSLLRARLSGLAPETRYSVQAFVETGASRLLSPAATFTTGRLETQDPVLEITSLATMPVEAGAASLEITYEVLNADDDTTPAKASSPETWLRNFDNSTPGRILFEVGENTGAERKAVVTVTYPGAEAQTVTVVQAAAEAPEPEEPLVITLTAESGWPGGYTSTRSVLEGYEFDLTDAAVFSSNPDRMQFKKGSGYIANVEDMGPIRSVRVEYDGDEGNLKLFVGGQQHPTQTEIAAEVEGAGRIRLFDCTEYEYPYFTLQNSNGGVSYVRSITIVCGGDGGGTPDPTPGIPSFGTPYYSALTKESVTLNCSFVYDGDEAVSQLYFAWRDSASSDERYIDVTPLAPGEKRAQLTGLTPSTSYAFRLCATVGGTFYSSEETTFRTHSEQSGTGDMPYPGWAELPLEPEVPGDYHYLHKFSNNARNYTVCYSERYNCAVWTAHPMHDWYMDGSAGRASFGYDPDLDRSLQPVLTSTYTPSTYHRGHMVASSDRQRTKEMNKQVFYYTNMAPQIQNEFNGGIWNKLEQKIQNSYTCSDTLYVVTGSYFGDPTKTCKDSEGKKTVVVPTHFYKVLLRSKSGNTRTPLSQLPASDLKCCAFWFEHSYKYGTKGTPSADDMLTVEEVERRTGFTFFPNVPNAPKSVMVPSEWGM